MIEYRAFVAVRSELLIGRKFQEPSPYGKNLNCFSFTKRAVYIRDSRAYNEITTTARLRRIYILAGHYKTKHLEPIGKNVDNFLSTVFLIPLCCLYIIVD